MAEFEVTVFHVLSEYFCLNPNSIEDFFGIKNNNEIKFSVDKVAQFPDIKSLVKNMVTLQLEHMHLSNVISSLKKYKPELFDNDYELIMEKIHRRNVILHNRGIVDKKYCESCNIFNLKVGDCVHVGLSYLIDSLFTLDTFIKKLCSTLDII